MTHWQKIWYAALAGGILAMLGGCTTGEVMFATYTSLGVGFDAASAKGHVGYDRDEVLVSPDYPDGGHLPVASSVTSNLSFTEPKTKQFFATGDAALIASNRIKPFESIDVLDKEKTKDLTAAQKCSLNLGCTWSQGVRRQSVIGTNTHVGLIVSTKDASLATLDFGFGRQEVAYLPVQQKAQSGGDVLPSALASIDVDAAASPTDLSLSQFFASGGPADALANNDVVRQAFGVIAKAKAIEAAAAEKEKAMALAKTLNMSDDQFQKELSIGASHAESTHKRMVAAVTKLLGREAKDDEKLTTDDEKSITASLSSLPGIAADKYALPPARDTAGKFRMWLDQHDDVESALIKQQNT